MMRTAQAFHMQQTFERMVVEIAGTPGDMAEHVLTLGRLADLV